jgi:hypothetical protein
VTLRDEFACRELSEQPEGLQAFDQSIAAALIIREEIRVGFVTGELFATQAQPLLTRRPVQGLHDLDIRRSDGDLIAQVSVADENAKDIGVENRICAVREICLHSQKLVKMPEMAGRRQPVGYADVDELTFPIEASFLVPFVSADQS